MTNSKPFFRNTLKLLITGNSVIILGGSTKYVYKTSAVIPFLNIKTINNRGRIKNPNSPGNTFIKIIFLKLNSVFLIISIKWKTIRPPIINIKINF